MQTNKQRVKKLSSTELQHRAQPSVAKKLIQNKSGDLHRFFVPSYFRVTNPWVLLECPSITLFPFEKYSQIKGKVISCANIYILPIQVELLV